jgi:hypothetical protein
MNLNVMEVIFASDLPCVERMVLLAIAKHSNLPGEACWPSMLTLAKLSGVNESTAVRAVAKLKEKGWVKARKRFSATTVYEVQLLHPASTGVGQVMGVTSISHSTAIAPVLAERQLSTCREATPVLAESTSNHPMNHPRESSRVETAPYQLREAKAPTIRPEEQDLMSQPSKHVPPTCLWIATHAKDPIRVTENRASLAGLIDRFTGKVVNAQAEKIAFSRRGEKPYPDDKELLAALIATVVPSIPARPAEEDHEDVRNFPLGHILHPKTPGSPNARLAKSETK